jgi:hypothetical protein
MRTIKYLIVILLLVGSNDGNSQKKTLTSKEQRNISLFSDFQNYVANSINRHEDINDSSHLKYMLLHFIFINKQLDSANETTLNENELAPEELKNLRKEINGFYTFLQGYPKIHLYANFSLIPMRLSTDSIIYRRLTKFQKENTFVFYDKRFPGNTLGYILFIPPIKAKLSAPRIWSWTLTFNFGKYFFESLTGEEGYEYLFDSEN